MWNTVTVGDTVLLELPSRWYLGTVLARNGPTIVLSPETALMGHDLGDTGQFLAGEISASTELTPLPRGIEINLGSVDSAQPYPLELLAKIRRRTHEPQGR